MSKGKNENVLGSRIKLLLDERGITQKDLAEALGITRPATINDWIKGRTEPRHYNLTEMADFFHVDVDYLLGRYDDPNLNATLAEWDAALAPCSIQKEIHLIEYVEYRLGCSLYPRFDHEEVNEFLKEIDEFIIFKYNKLKGNNENGKT
jgi:transcriptional regulator with XRE-family HTH domain